MDEPKVIPFTEMVESHLWSDENCQALWRPIAEAFDRDGPDAAKEYLEAEVDRLMQSLSNLLDQVEKG